MTTALLDSPEQLLLALSRALQQTAQHGFTSTTFATTLAQQLAVLLDAQGAGLTVSQTGGTVTLQAPGNGYRVALTFTASPGGLARSVPAAPSKWPQ